jgi:hypothetical protein
LNGASTADYEATIMGLDIDGFRRFMALMLRMCAPGQPYGKHFGSGISAFKAACCKIVERGDEPRLAAMLKRLFRDSGLGQLPPPLVPPADAVSPGAVEAPEAG